MSAARDARLSLLLLGPVLLASVFALVRFALEGGDVPTDDDYVAARQLIEDDGFDRTQDRLAILPPWSLRPLQFLGDLPWVSGDGLAARPLHRVRRLYVVKEPDPGPELGALNDKQRLTLVGSAGPVDVYRVDTAGPSVTFDFTADFKSAQISLNRSRGQGGDEELTRCDERDFSGGFKCRGRKRWQRVSKEHLLVTENGDSALWAHPPPPGETLRLVYENVPLGDVLVIRAGHTRKGSTDATAPVEVDIFVDGVPIASISRRPQFLFATDVIDLKENANKTGTVRFDVHAVENGRNHFAFDAYTARDASTAGGGQR